MDKVPQGLPEFLADLREQELPVPDSLTEYYIARAGCSVQDISLLRTISAGLHLILEGIAGDALQASKRRQSLPATRLKKIGFDGEDKRIVLTIEDLKEAFTEIGVPLSKPLYLQSSQQPEGKSANDNSKEQQQQQ